MINFFTNTNLKQTFLITQATISFTKGLLGLGAENNLDDVKHANGYSISAILYRRNWQYLTEHQQTDSIEHFNPRYENIFHSHNHVARVAACACMVHTGACDDHAYVLFSLLMQLLPKNTQINICSFIDSTTQESIPHTFIVIGNLKHTSLKLNKLDLNNLYVASAWTIYGGICTLSDYWLVNEFARPQNLILNVDHYGFADNEDRLIKRLLKQIRLHANLTQNTSLNRRETGLFHHTLYDQKVYPTKLESRALTDHYDIYDIKLISKNSITIPREQILDTIQTIFQDNPNLKHCLEWVDNRISQSLDVNYRLHSYPI